MMKKWIKLILAIFLILWVTFIITDYYRATQNKAPIFAIKFGGYWDGGTIEYLGLGYKVIKYNQLGIYDEDCMEEYREKFGSANKMSDYEIMVV
jgi:hypothetical protein